MQVDVRQQWRQNGALRCALFGRTDQPIFQDATLQHPDDQPNHAFVPNSVPQKLDHPFVVDRIKERFDVGLYHVGDPCLLEGLTERIYTHVLAAPRSVSKAAVFEYGLVDRF